MRVAIVLVARGIALTILLFLCFSVAGTLPVIRMMKGARLETALAVGLLFAVVMNAQLLLPNAYMPEAVRMAHLVETASSNFIFGAIVAWLLSTRHGPARSVAAPNAPPAR